VHSVQAYVDKVLALNRIRDRHPHAGAVVVRERAGVAAAHYEFGAATIAVPVRGRAWALRELVVLHELAHHLAPRGDAAPHGPGFCRTYLELVDEIIGPEASFLLGTSFHACAVPLN
jgi:putative metallohydrolase (TIGR04338 family)